MADRQWVIPGGGAVHEEGTEEYVLPGVGAIAEDQAAAGGLSIPVAMYSYRRHHQAGV